MIATETRAYLAEWQAMEDRFFRAILNAADLYMLGIRLARAIAETLRSTDDLDALAARFQRTSSDDVIPIADALDAPQTVLLDFPLALGAAFHLRAREIQEATAGATLQRRIEAARAGQDWVVLVESSTRHNGKSLFQRLEMHLPDGFGIHTASELDWERGLIYVLEPLLLDPQDGRRRTDAPPPAPPSEFASSEELHKAADDLRRSYAR